MITHISDRQDVLLCKVNKYTHPVLGEYCFTKQKILSSGDRKPLIIEIKAFNHHFIDHGRKNDRDRWP